MSDADQTIERAVIAVVAAVKAQSSNTYVGDYFPDWDSITVDGELSIRPLVSAVIESMRQPAAAADAPLGFRTFTFTVGFVAGDLTIPEEQLMEMGKAESGEFLAEMAKDNGYALVGSPAVERAGACDDGTPRYRVWQRGEAIVGKNY